MALGRVPSVGAVTQKRGAEAGVVPCVHLLQPPDFENVRAAVADGDRAGRVLNLSELSARIAPVVDEGTVRAYPYLFTALLISTALCVAQVVFDQRLRCARRTQFGPQSVRPGAGAAIDQFRLHI